MRAIKVMGAPSIEIIDGKGAFSTASAKLLRNVTVRPNHVSSSRVLPIMLHWDVGRVGLIIPPVAARLREVDGGPAQSCASSAGERGPEPSGASPNKHHSCTLQCRDVR